MLSHHISPFLPSTLIPHIDNISALLSMDTMKKKAYVSFRISRAYQIKVILYTKKTFIFAIEKKKRIQSAYEKKEISHDNSKIIPQNLHHKFGVEVEKQKNLSTNNLFGIKTLNFSLCMNCFQSMSFTFLFIDMYV